MVGPSPSFVGTLSFWVARRVQRPAGEGTASQFPISFLPLSFASTQRALPGFRSETEGRPWCLFCSWIVRDTRVSCPAQFHFD